MDLLCQHWTEPSQRVPVASMFCLDNQLLDVAPPYRHESGVNLSIWALDKESHSLKTKCIFIFYINIHFLTYYILIIILIINLLHFYLFITFILHFQQNRAHLDIQINKHNKTNSTHPTVGSISVHSTAHSKYKCQSPHTRTSTSTNAHTDTHP